MEAEKRIKLNCQRAIAPLHTHQSATLAADKSMARSIPCWSPDINAHTTTSTRLATQVWNTVSGTTSFVCFSYVDVRNPADSAASSTGTYNLRMDTGLKQGWSEQSQEPGPLTGAVTWSAVALARQQGTRRPCQEGEAVEWFLQTHSSAATGLVTLVRPENDCPPRLLKACNLPPCC